MTPVTILYKSIFLFSVFLLMMMLKWKATRKRKYRDAGHRFKTKKYV